MAVKQVNTYECNTCGELYSYSRDAEGCCPPKSVVVWDCGCLGQTASTECPQYRCHRSEEEAQWCAAERGPDAICECGCKIKWHDAAGLCLSPGCACRRVTAGEAP